MSMMIGGLPFLDFFFCFLEGERRGRLGDFVRLSGRKKESSSGGGDWPSLPWSITPFRAVQIGIGIDLKKKRNSRA
jgi:hypothetical protein